MLLVSILPNDMNSWCFFHQVLSYKDILLIRRANPWVEEVDDSVSHTSELVA